MLLIAGFSHVTLC
uniref:Uncharacterized protein n=1 Tax=Anguilla anguilla TaxID=7936 RepID=A0A0E9Q5Y8_ANGAN